MNRAVLELAERPASKQPLSLSVNHRIAISDDGGGIAQQVAELLKQQGYQAEVYGEIPADVDGLLFLNGLADFKNSEEAENINTQAFQAAKALAGRLSQKGGFFVTVQDTGGHFGFEKADEVRIWSSGLTGLIKTAAQEWPKAHCKAIDLDKGRLKPKAIAEKIVSEFLSGSLDLECGLTSEGKRLVPTTTTQLTEKEALRLKPQSVMVVSGGARGVTAACLLALSKAIPCRFALLGRTPLEKESETTRLVSSETDLRKILIGEAQQKKEMASPKEIEKKIAHILALREIDLNLQKLRDAGSEVLYFSVDVTDGSQVELALKQVREKWGPIHGIIHGAGHLADKLILQKTQEQFDGVFATKIQGLKNLLAATRKDPLECLVMFSSVAARYGNFGQCDYAMANEVLNKVSHFEKQKRGKSCLVKSLNWGPWEGGMVTPQLKALFAKRGIAVLPLDVGSRLFVEELQSKESSSLEVILGSGLDKPKPVIFEASVKNYPFLTSHTILGKPVVPAMLSAEWFYRGLAQLRPGSYVQSLSKLQILKGVRFEDFEGTENLYLKANGDGDELALSLENKSGIRNYGAIAILGNQSPKPIKDSLPDVTTPWPWGLDAIYRKGKLFHGPLLHVIRSLITVSKEGGTAEIFTAKGMGWDLAPWQTDLAALDGALQLLNLYGFYTLDKPSLPMAIGKLVIRDTLPTSDTLLCSFKSEMKGKLRTVSDVFLYDTSGKVYAEMRNVELVTSFNEDHGPF